MKSSLKLLLILSAAVLMISSAFAQRGLNQRTNYDPATEITIKGTVEEVKEQTCPTCGWSQKGTHLSVKSDNGIFDVRLGPTQFLANHNFSFAKGDQIEIIGSKVKIEGADAVIAREVKKGGKSLTLRNPQGIPAWSRGRRG
jgi:hypothetical protein